MLSSWGQSVYRVKGTVQKEDYSYPMAPHAVDCHSG